MEAGDNILKVYNISSNNTEEFVRGLYLELELNISSGLSVYLCSRNHGVLKPDSFCGSYKYEELIFTSPKEIMGKRDYDYMVLEGSAINSTGKLAVNAILETY